MNKMNNFWRTSYFNDAFMGEDEPIGVAVATICREQKLPCILVTSQFHHGAKLQWVTMMVRALGMPEIEDQYPNESSKPWKRGLEALLELIQKESKMKSSKLFKGGVVYLEASSTYGFTDFEIVCGKSTKFSLPTLELKEVDEVNVNILLLETEKFFLISFGGNSWQVPAKPGYQSAVVY